MTPDTNQPCQSGLVGVTALRAVGRNHQQWDGVSESIANGVGIIPLACRDCGMPRPDNTWIINLFARMDEAGRAMAQSLQARVGMP